MENKPEISVVVPTYNRSQSLLDTLAALSAQTLDKDKYEVIIVDDGSADDTTARVAEFAAKNPSLCLRYERNEKNRYKPAACNRGIRAARAELIAFTDDDIRPVPGWLGAHLDRHKSEPSAKVSVTGLVLYPEEWERKSNWIHFANANYRLNETIRSTAKMGLPPNRLAGGNTSIPREVLFQVGLFSEDMRRGLDGDLACRLYKMGVPLLFEPKALVYHYAEAIRSIDQTLRSFRRYYENDRRQMKERHGWFFEKYGHWFLEPVCQKDELRRKWAKRFVRLVARKGGQGLALRWVRAVDSIPWLYFRPIYRYVMACEAVDGIRASERAEPQ